MPRKDPPKEYRFKPGQSGNPGGRPKGDGVISKAVIRQLAELDPRTLKSIAEKIVAALIKKALKGGIFHAQFLADRSEGKVKDVLKIEGEDLMPGVSDEELARRLLNKGKQKPNGK